jgi:hypothetical protein
MVEAFINLASKIPGGGAKLDLSIDVKEFISDVKDGAKILEDEGKKTLTTEFKINKEKFDKENKRDAKKILDVFDQFLGFKDIAEIAIKDGEQAGGEIAQAQKDKPKELQALEKGSAEAFRAINRPQQNAALNIAKAGVKEQEKTNKKLDKIGANLRAEPILTVIPS